MTSKRGRIRIVTFMGYLFIIYSAVVIFQLNFGSFVESNRDIKLALSMIDSMLAMIGVALLYIADVVKYVFKK